MKLSDAFRKEKVAFLMMPKVICNVGDARVSISRFV